MAATRNARTTWNVFAAVLESVCSLALSAQKESSKCRLRTSPTLSVSSSTESHKLKAELAYLLLAEQL
jgi:hypothetical protein